MRKRNIKTVAHWVIMCFLLLFPIVLVGISAFANDEQSVTVTETYQYETNDVNDENDLVSGNIYYFSKVNMNTLYQNRENIDFTFYISYFGFMDFDIQFIDMSNGLNLHVYTVQETSYYLYLSSEEGYILTLTSPENFYFVIDGIDENVSDYDIYQNISASDYLGEVTTTVDIQNSNYKQEVNNWANGFKNLPVNQWYGQLLNVCGVGQTTNSVMNVIYVYPLYVLWVYLIDLILDCLLVIVNLGHNVLKRVDGDIE